MAEVWLDIGNSCAKLLQPKLLRPKPLRHGSAADGAPSAHPDTATQLTRLAHGDSLASQLKRYLADCAQSEPITRIAIASSAGESVTQCCTYVCADYCSAIHHFASHASEQGVTSGYNRPSSLGVDRWLCLLGARSLTETAVMVLDAGTALTCDFLDPSGQHLGGWIVPNQPLLSQALTQLPTLARATKQEHIDGYGTSTDQAITGGARRMVWAFLQAEWAQFCLTAQQNNWPVACYATGGDEVARAFVHELGAQGQRAEYCSQLVFFGMARSLGCCLERSHTKMKA